MISDFLKEKIETLDGSRSKQNRRKAAVRLEDLAGLLALPPELKSAHAAGDAPTAAEFDALVDDVHEIQRRLTALRDALQARIL
jgi:hypothetical protein